MFINFRPRVNFSQLKKILILISLIFFSKNLLNAQFLIKGVVVESDSTTVVPFVYVINKSNGNGTMTDNEGRFSLSTQINDTLICSSIGFSKQYLSVSEAIKTSNKGEVKLVMMKQYINLNTVTVNTFKYKPYERMYMNDIIERSKIRQMDYATSPISALYMRFSKEGKQISKLAKIFESILIEEQVQKKLSKQILTRLTGDDTIDYEAFRKYCYEANDYYIITHEGIELYTKVMDCYRRWKADGR